MAGYEDTRQKIISTLIGRPVGTEIQPENQQDYELNMLDYIRSLELIATSTLIGVAESNTTPVQPNASRVCYIAGVAQNQTVTFENFIGENGNPISVTTGDMEGVFIILMWNTQYWSAQTFSTNIISHSESATFYYRYNIRKTYASIALMNADVASPIGSDGKYIKIGDIVTVVNSTTPSENGIYSYEGATDGWKYQSSFNFQLEQNRSQNPNTSPSSKLFDDTIKKGQSAIMPTSDFANYNGVEITSSVTGIYLYDQTINEAPGYTGSGYKTFTYQTVYGDGGNYTPDYVYCKGIKGANNAYRSILIVDADGNEIFKTNQSGNFRFLMYHNWTIQVTCDSLYFGGTTTNIKTKFESIETIIDGKDSISKFVKLQKNATIDERNAESWITGVTRTTTEKTMEGMSIPVTQFVFPSSFTGSTNKNILGFDVPHGVNNAIGDKIKIYVAIHSDKQIDSVILSLDNAGTATIDSTNLTKLKIGWNFIWFEMTMLVANPNVSYIVINATNATNATNFASATICVSKVIKTNNFYYSALDFALSDLIGKYESLSNLSGIVNAYSIIDKINSSYNYFAKTNLDSWQTDTVISDSTKTHNGVTLSGKQYVFGTLTSATGGSNGNVWGLSILSKDDGTQVLRTNGTIVTILFSIWSDRDMAQLTPGIYFANSNAVLHETDFTSLKEGWNSKFVKIRFTADAVANEMEFFLFNRDSDGNRTSMAGATIFVAKPIISDYDITYLDYNIAELYKSLENVSIGSNVIPCYGDSLTAGAGAEKTTNKDIVIAKLQSFGITTALLESSSPTYPITMQAITGSKYNVVNCGVGGENINTIAARQGAAPILVPKQFVLPQTAGTTVEIADSVTDTLKSSFDGVSVVSPLLQGSGNSVNPCYIEGIECILSIIAGTPNRYYLTRTTNGSRDVTIPSGTSLILQGSKAFRNPKAAIIWCWQNGGYSDDNDLIVKLDKIISNVGTSNYVLVGLHTGTESTRATQEALLQSKYGNRFFNWRKYVSTNALYDFGITPTTDADLTASQISNGVKSDTYQMSIGALPSSLWRSVYGVDGDTSNDSVHMNAAGYMILGYKLIERLKIIGTM